MPLLDEFKQRISHTLETHPYIVAESDGEIIGYAYAGKYHPRAAYSWDAETTIYLDNNFRETVLAENCIHILRKS